MTTAASDPIVASEIDSTILKEAAAWLVTLRSGEATEHDRAALKRWRAISPAHEAAWQRAEGVLATFGRVPGALGRETLPLRARSSRRRHVLGLFAVGGPLAWLAWRGASSANWAADLRTATGERKALDLVDGTHLALNTASAVDIQFDRHERRVVLRDGEILVTTAADRAPVPRAFLVVTTDGILRPLGTRFVVRRLADHTRVAVLEGAVDVRPAGGMPPVTVRSGQQLTFSASRVQQPEPADPGAALWERGMLLARDMRLDDLLAELARHHRGVLHCDPAIAGLKVSGAFPLADTPSTLALLEKSLPVRIGGLPPYWIRVDAR